MENQAVVELINVKKQIGNINIIDDISLKVFQGEVFGFLGPNGAGKTTTIRMMVGLIGITEGEVLINGVSIKKNYEKAILNVGGIIENPEMYKFMSGYDNLIHYARMVPKKVTKERINKVVQLVGLEKSINHKVGRYSLGMRQRLGLAQALLHSPSLLILDEPTNGLDPAGIREIRTYIRKIAHEENMAVFVSSHLLSEMQLMCDRIGIIQNGKLVRVETMGDIVDMSKEATIRIHVEPLDEAFHFLYALYEKTDIEIEDNFIKISLKQEQIPQCNKALVENDFMVYGITSTQTTLEDKFLEITEEK
ncbi:ABC transporter ATP-binding protein [Texcoconibacillus texcoconensis]|uniref:ABC-2 type transport system ATP-binding protein n=1 Tax=Texcoconibacillus texcoconensis TaxID=1095777 RepID=A0A840QIK0_9BACI|nr:ABC transporter ATP-binding protein [Texcoconibacillus texcoconensis]MBB5171939.1 ABC-2 type transport system ATP-binding protein [Texcoconibacillus texcoconensis]